MAQTLTTPEARADVTQQGIVTIIIKFPHARNAGDTAMEMDKPNFEALYEVFTWDEEGNTLNEELASVSFDNWPSGFKLDVRDLYAKAESHAVNNGYIGAGTPEVIN